ncbi:hypothetical protein ACFVMC_28235 [Nocardia sp. NPDC127579]|uniref:hypothetical protein n=1 Tax=Nocardia sp. NPDC127579 TaxID=3345402 RepID=UPI0036374BA8
MTMIAAAVAAGAAAGLTETAKNAISDAYLALKGLITRRYETVDLGVVESKPELASRRAVLAEELSEAGAGADEELIEAARQLLAAIQDERPEAAEIVGVRLRRIESGQLEITDIAAVGSGVVVEDAKVAGAVKITGVRAGGSGPIHPPNARP